MRIEHGLLRKLAPAVGALERLLARVRPKVDDQAVALHEASGAVRALEGLLASVEAVVHHEVLLQLEARRTGVTPKLSLRVVIEALLDLALVHKSLLHITALTLQAVGLHGHARALQIVVAGKRV